MREIELKMATISKALGEAKEKKCDKIIVEGCLGKFTVNDEPEIVNIYITGIQSNETNPNP